MLTPSPQHARPALLALLTVTATLAMPARAAAESAIATTDLEIELATATPNPARESTFVVELTLRNEGNFGVDGATVTLPIPAGLTFVSATGSPGSGDYDQMQQTWTTGSLASFDRATLELTLVVDAAGPVVIPLVADLASFSGSFGATDIDSTPGNMDPCEDDYAALHLHIVEPQVDAGTDGADAGAAMADAGPDCSPPSGNTADAGARPDAGAAADGAIDPTSDAAGSGFSDGSEAGCGCSQSSGTGNGGWAIVVAALLALRRRRGSAQATSAVD